MHSRQHPLFLGVHFALDRGMEPHEGPGTTGQSLRRTCDSIRARHGAGRTLRDQPKLCLGGEQWVTLRIYAKPDLATSEVFKVYGTADEPLRILSEFEAYNSIEGLTVSSQEDCANLNNLCTLSDSYMTIGLTEEARAFPGCRPPSMRKSIQAGPPRISRSSPLTWRTMNSPASTTSIPWICRVLKNRDGACLWKTCFRSIANRMGKASCFWPKSRWCSIPR